MYVSLKFIAGPIKGTLYDLEPGEYIIGRQESCEIQAPDAGVSRQHSRIWSEGKDWYIEDLGSQNGTYVNRQRVTNTRLALGDVIGISSHQIQVGPSRSSRFVESVTVTKWAQPPLYMADETVDVVVASDSDTLIARKLSAVQGILEAAANTPDPNQLLEQIVAKLLDVFPDAESVGVLVQDEKTGELSVKCRVERDQRYGSELEVPSTIIEHVSRQRRGILLGDPQSGVATPTDEPVGSRMGAPLAAHDTSYGVIYVGCRPSRRFTRQDVNLLTSIAAQAGLALHSARVHQELARRERFDRDVRVARQIQRSLLPEAPPDIIGLDIAAHYEAAHLIGGDFYDFIWHDKDKLAFVIGDVAGKSISAALYMARLTGELRSRSGLAQTPSRLLRQVNEAVHSLGDDGMFATVIYAVYDFANRVLRFSNAGHMPPLLRRAGRVSAIGADSAHVPPLGVLQELEIGEASIQLQRGDVILLTTDGIHEARNEAKQEYGEQRLARCLRAARGSSADLIESILTDVVNHTRDAAFKDDVTIVAVGIGEARARRRGETDVKEIVPTRARVVTAG